MELSNDLFSLGTLEIDQKQAMYQYLNIKIFILGLTTIKYYWLKETCFYDKSRRII